MEIFKCIVKSHGISPEDPAQLWDFCTPLEDGTAVEMRLSVWESGRSENASRYFHKLRDRYAGAMGYTRANAKVELKYNWGDSIRYDDAFDPPPWPGEFVELYGCFVFLKSTAAYTTKEMNLLIEGTVKSCIENSIDIEDLIKERRANE